MFLKSKKTLKNVKKRRAAAYVQFHRPLNHSAFNTQLPKPKLSTCTGKSPTSHIPGGTLKTRDWKTQDWKTWDQIAGVEKKGLENAGTSCVWVAKCNIINVRGHVRVNVTNSDFADHVFVTWKV